MLGGCSGKEMSNQTGLKHVPTEPAQLEGKRKGSRRRAGGRAAALRRAPSDSDCSGETASLSADSAERAPRALPPPTRQAKSRSSRRRGSEWEVLEGLKDGQRFEKRPEVFNGYLHKKRKWPLKGWHKRFFVVDGGILVYARSPSDVARGRLHGSVDVGLSVISAKARRRRIDIDADEFIYHLRAKTPDAFRTWLNVLKTHRLYRQHLLTFGARESVPKIHAPLEDLPPAETTSQSLSRSESWYLSSVGGEHIESQSTCTSSFVPLSSLNILPRKPRLKKCPYKNLRTNYKEQPQLDSSIRNTSAINKQTYKHGSLCSMNCLTKAQEIAKKFEHKNNRAHTDPNTNDKDEILVHSTDLDLRLGSKCLQTTRLYSQNKKLERDKNVNQSKVLSKTDVITNGKDRITRANNCVGVTQTEPIVYCFTHKPRSHSTNTDQPVLKRSKKSTNMVRYKNCNNEPPLKRPFSKCMLLGKYKLKVSRQSDARSARIVRATKSDLAEREHREKGKEENGSEVDRMTDKLIETVFESYRKPDRQNCEDHLRSFIDQVVTELYCFSCHRSDDHPVKALFKCLLEYWIRNASFDSFSGRFREVKSVGRPSNRHFTKDQNTSSQCVQNFSKETQFGYSDELVKRKLQNSMVTSIKHTKGKQIGTVNADADQRIQELERMLNNTVYYCENINTATREEDIRMTKTLIRNIGKESLRITSSHKFQGLRGATELSELQKTINKFLNDTSIPPEMAKDIFNAYLSILTDGSTNDSSNMSAETPKAVEQNHKCDVLTECVQKKISKCIMTQKYEENNQQEQTEFFEDASTNSGRIYLNDVLNKISIEPDNRLYSESDNEKTTHTMHKYKRFVKENDKLETSSKYNYQESAKQIYKRNNIVIYLSKYNLEQNSSTNHPLLKKMMSVSFNIEENFSKLSVSNPSKLNLKWTDKKRNYYSKVSDSWKSHTKKYLSDSEEIFQNIFGPSTNCIPYNYLYKYCVDSNENLNIKPFCSSSEVTSKRCLNNSRYSKFRILSLNSNLTDSQRKSPQVIHNLKSEVFPRKEVMSCNLYLNEITKSPEIKSQLPYTECEASPIENDIIRNVNENAIILLLNNLSELSECIPLLQRDLHLLYQKLFKECRPTVKFSKECKSIDDDNSRLKKKVDIQCTDFLCDVKLTSRDEVETNTTFPSHIKNTTRVYDKSQNSPSPIKLLNNAKLQTDEEDCTELLKRTIMTNKGISNQNSYRQLCTRDFSINTALQLKEYKCGNPDSLKKKSPIRKGAKTIGPLKNIRNIIKEMPILQLKLSKSYGINKSLLPKNTLTKDYNVYQLFLSHKFKKNCSSSMIESKPKLESSGDLRTLYRRSSDLSFFSGLVSPTGAPLRGPQAGFVSGTPGGRLAGWIIDSGAPLENVSRELGQAQLSVQQLQRLLDALEMQQVHHDTDVSLEGASPNVKKDRRKFGLRKKKSNSKCASVELQPPHMDPSNSHMALSALTAPPSPGGGASSIPNSAASLPIACAATRPQSLPGAEALGGTTGAASIASLTPDHQLREDFAVLAKDLVASLKGIVSTLVCERGRLRAAAEAGEAAGGATLAALRSNLSTALHQNSELRSRLSRIHDASDLAEISSMGPSDQNRQFQQSLSYSSSCVSASEFFDAEEHEEDLKPTEILGADEAGVIELDGDSSSEAGSLSSEEGSASSDNSDAAMVTAEPVSMHLTANGSASIEGAGDSMVTVGSRPLQRGNSWSRSQPTSGWTRRTRLPSTRPTPGGPSLWNLLYKNIGKDLSQISMPVTINEPLNMLQRLCEELEYSELLDAACTCSSAAERMALVAAFAVSSYAASAHRAASKPFNPLLAETYECVRADRGFKFVAEQVSHHPPISACHAESQHWTFWQEARIRTKFWGKSMEFQPAGRVHVRLKATGDHYSWNKVTTCVHNLFGGQRWVDQYGDMHLTCHGTDVTCKLNFVKASSWSSSRHEVRGAVTWSGGRLRLAGRWSEALSAGEPPAARCLWRPGAMPPEHELYYGFTRFAMELNELEPGMKDLLPHTDTRLRPDQRALEEGDVESAERLKLQLEQAQRERRRDATEHTPAWFRKMSEGGEEMWLFTGEYWKAREAGFPGLSAPHIW